MNSESLKAPTNSGDQENLASDNRRLQYKNLIEAQTSSKGDKDIEDEMCALHKIIRSSNNLIMEGKLEDRVRSGTEVVLDAQVVQVSHERFRKIVDQVIDAQCGFRDEEYINSLLKAVYGRDCENWNNVAEIVNETAQYGIMVGSFLGADNFEIITEEEKQEKQRKSKPNKQVISKEHQPERLKEIEKENDKAERVQLVLKEIRKLAMELNTILLPFWKLVIDPNDFETTIDNAFQIAMLVNQGFLGIQKSSDGYPEIKLISKEEKYNKSFMATVQSICSFDMEFIEEMVEKYNIKESMLPPMQPQIEANVDPSFSTSQYEPQPSTSGLCQASTSIGVRYSSETDTDDDD